MAIPDYQTVMQPLLEVLLDGTERRFSQIVPTLAEHFRLTGKEQAQLLPSGRQETFRNRVHWASFYVLKGGVLERPRRGHLRITARGVEALRQGTPINTAFLRQYPEFREFVAPASRDAESVPAVPDTGVPQHTPEEQLEAGYVRHRASLASDLLAKLRECSPQYFEQVVVDLLVAMGYGGSRRDAGRAVGRAGDGGIDGIIKEDHLGLDGIYVQAKRWEASVGRPVVQAFAGSLEGHRARKGVLITTSDFTAEARDYVTRIEKRIVLISGVELADLMVEHGVGVTDVTTYVLKRLDSDYFDEGE